MVRILIELGYHAGAPQTEILHSRCYRSGYAVAGKPPILNNADWIASDSKGPPRNPYVFAKPASSCLATASACLRAANERTAIGPRYASAWAAQNRTGRAPSVRSPAIASTDLSSTVARLSWVMDLERPMVSSVRLSRSCSDIISA